MRLFPSDKDRAIRFFRSSINLMIHDHVRILGKGTLNHNEQKVLENALEQHFKTSMDVYLEYNFDRDALIHKLFHTTLVAINDIRFTSKLLAPNVHNGIMEGVEVNKFAKSRIMPIQNFVNNLSDEICLFLANHKIKTDEHGSAPLPAKDRMP